MPKQLSMPNASWTVLKRIIRAYGAVQDEDSPTVEAVAKLAGMLRPVVSGNNNFLREIGVLLPEKNKLTELGARLAMGLGTENESLLSQTLQDLIRTNPILSQFVNLIRARGSMKVELLKAEIALAGGLNDKSRQLPFIKAIVDLLQESKLIQVNEDLVRGEGATPTQTQPMEIHESAVRTSPRASQLYFAQNGSQIPLPLGPTRLAYIQLPDDWTAKELPKLIKILQIALGEDPDGV